MRLSENFSLNEMIKSREATLNGIENNPSTEEIVALTSLCHRILQPIRESHGVVSVSSGFRCKQLAPLVFSSIKSQHCFGEAADFECFSVDNKFMAIWITKNIPEWDDLILEHYDGKNPNSGWIHCSFKRDGKNRKRVRKAYKKGLRTVYDDLKL